MKAKKSSQSSSAAAKSKQKPRSGNKSPFLFTAGISEGKNFPLSGRESSPYNVDGKSNTLSDYFPVPYFQYYIGNRIYLRTAFYFNDPQYIHSQLLDSTGVDTSSTFHVTSSTTLRKLYYTSIPLTVHYRVFDNLYLGAGIQFSSLKQALIERNTTYKYGSGAGDSAYTHSVSTLSGDTSYKHLQKTDWRLLIEVNYNWKRFTIGAHYQQSLSPYLTTAPYGVSTPNKNASFGFYIQYDLWQRPRKR